ncbi:MAG TPA: MTH1187 family thiamine-binding protein [candidate division Zixibacteria bacterium]|nr:MTH1187 family thiamine-binding protein [candidate division Zixibacteria bacterium]
MPLANVTVIPLGTESPSLSKYIAECVKEIEKSGIKHTLTPFGSVLEGDLDQIFDVIKKIHEVPFKLGVQRVATLINIDDRRDKKATANGKIKSVMEKLE